MGSINRTYIQNTKAEIESLLHTSWDLVSKRNSEIENLSQKALELANSIDSNNYRGLAIIESALYECLVKNNYYQSIKLCTDGFNLMKGEFKKRYAAYYHLNLGRNYHFLGDNVLTQKHYLECIKLLEHRPDKNYYEKRWLAHTYYNIFILFNFTGAEFAQSEYLEKALKVYEEIEDSGGVANCYNSYAVYYFKQNELKSSLEYLLKARDLALKENATSFLSIYCSNIGLVYTKMGMIETGEKYFADAQEYDLLINSTYHSAHTHNQMGEANAMQKKFDKAIEHFKIAEQYFESVGVKKALSTLYDNLSQSYIGINNYEEAYRYQKKYADSLKDLFNDEKTFAIARARNEYELEIKEQEAQLLRSKNEQIAKYANQLEFSNSELRQFAHVASHDLREPLRMVSSYVQLLERGLRDKLDDDQKEFMQFIIHGTHTMQNLISDLLTLSGISFVRSLEAVDLNKVLKIVSGTLKSQIAERNVIINSPVLPVLQADETHMVQLFQNLISNAIKYNKSEQPVIDITYNLTAKKYHFAVADNGIGIPEEYKEKIFLIFQRLHSRDEYSGTGIGLAICKKIIDQAGGKIWVEANNNHGCIFKFTLPLTAN